MRLLQSLLLVSLVFSSTVSIAPSADACGCQKKALQNMLKLQEEAERLHLQSQVLRIKARSMNAVGKTAEAQTLFDDANRTALSELQSAENNQKAAKGTHAQYRFALMHAAEVAKERGRFLDQHHIPLAYQMYEQALQLEQKAGMSTEEMELTYQTLITLLMQAKEYSKAEPYAQKLLAYRQSSGGRYSPSLAQSLQTHATILRKLGRVEEAKQAEQQSKAIAGGAAMFQ